MPFSFTYLVSMESIGVQNKVVMRATIMKVTRIVMTFTVEDTLTGCVVEESISFKSILPVKLLRKLIFRKQHTELFRKIEQVPF